MLKCEAAVRLAHGASALGTDISGIAPAIAERALQGGWLRHHDSREAGGLSTGTEATSATSRLSTRRFSVERLCMKSSASVALLLKSSIENALSLKLIRCVNRTRSDAQCQWLGFSLSSSLRVMFCDNTFEADFCTISLRYITGTPAEDKCCAGI